MPCAKANHSAPTSPEAPSGHRLLHTWVLRTHITTLRSCSCWEVLYGVGVHGVGVIFPFLRTFRFFTHFFAFLSLFFVFLRFSLLLLKDKGKQEQFTAKNGEFHSDPVCTDPVQNFPILNCLDLRSLGRAFELTRVSKTSVLNQQCAC